MINHDSGTGRWAFEGETISTYIENTGRPLLVLFHAFNSNYRAFNALINQSARPFDIATLDFPGHGKSSFKQPISFESYARLGAHFITSLARNNITVMGHSLGGGVAMFISHHRAVKKVILLASINPFILDERMPKWLEARLFPTTMFDARASYLALIHNPHQINYLRNVALGAKFLLQQTKTTRARFNYLLTKQILNPLYLQTTLLPIFLQNQKPVVTIYGEYDQIVLPASHAKIAHKIGARKIVIKNCGHAPLYEYPQQISALLAQLFL